jgi:hypothetical protein
LEQQESRNLTRTKNDRKISESQKKKFVGISEEEKSLNLGRKNLGISQTSSVILKLRNLGTSQSLAESCKIIVMLIPMFADQNECR